MKNFTVRYTYKHPETGEMRVQDMQIEDIERGFMSGFAAVMPGLNGFELINRSVHISSREEEQNNVNDVVRRMRLLEQDHTPDGYPAVQMKDISALCDVIDTADKAGTEDKAI